MLLEHLEGVLEQFEDIFHGLVAVDVYTLFSTADQILSEMAKKWMKRHVRRPGCSLGMCMEHVEGILAQFHDIFHGLVAVDVYTLFPTADQILSEMAKNG